METTLFPKVKYRQFKNTFLKSVMVEFSFDSFEGDAQVLNERFKDYVQTAFNIPAVGNLLQGEHNITKKDMSLGFHFSNGQAGVRLDGQRYLTFSETAIPQVFKLRPFFNKVIETPRLNKISIRKINIWNFQASQKNTISENSIESLIFSKELISSLNSNELNEQEREIEGLKKSIFSDDSGLKVEIKTVLLPPDKTNPKDNYHHLVLDITGTIENLDGFKVETMPEELMDLNSSLYYCFNWCVTPYVINLMTGE